MGPHLLLKKVPPEEHLQKAKKIILFP